jgi:16S rRNA (cytosine1402-N4)-methyltransferase
MKHYTTLFNRAVNAALARASWPLPEPALAYFPNVRSALSDRDLDAGALIKEVAMASKSDADHGHIPVLIDRCVELLAPALTRQNADGEGAVLIDATLGAGGHAERFLTELPGLRLIGLDRDPTPCGSQASGWHSSVTGSCWCGPATTASRVCSPKPVTGQAKCTASCSTSACRRCNSDRTARGFSYAADAPLDMRMDPDAALTAAEVVNTYDEKTLTQVLREFGEERFAGRIAAQIVRRRLTGRSPPPVSWWSCCIRRSPRPPGAPAGIPPSAPSKRCASSSTASWTRCVTRFPRRLARWLLAAESP